MITHKEIRVHLKNAGFRVGGANHTSIKDVDTSVFVAVSEERGVHFLWHVCDQRYGYGTCNISCPSTPHIHLSTRVRLSAGKSFGTARPKWSVPTSFNELDEHRGAPSERTKITKKQLPEPYTFKEARFVKNGNVYQRSVVIVKAELLGPVGITKNAKLCSDMAAIPDEPVWWHFSCDGATTATFNIITDGDVWHPVNRRSYKITTQLRPKKSVDLTFISIEDRNFMMHIIRDYIATL